MRRFYPALQWLGGQLRISIPIAVCVAGFISLMIREPFHVTLLYSVCIGFLIQGLFETGRYGLAHLLRKRFPDDVHIQNNWPGWKLMAPWIFISGTAGYFGGHMLGDLLLGVHRTPAANIHNPRMLVLIMAIVFAVSVGCVYFFYARGRMASMQASTQLALRTATESQLKVLEAQLEPHMLFNTLANLRVLIGIDPPRAQAMLDRMISFLRATLEASRSGSHALSAEFDRIDDYLEMMKVRMGPRLQVSLDLPVELARLQVPPLLLQPLIENAIKHGLEPKVEGGRIEIRVRREGDVLTLYVRDTGAGLGELSSDGTHFGLQQVRERLAALYGNAAGLELKPVVDEEGGTLVTVHLPVSQLPVSTMPSEK